MHYLSCSCKKSKINMLWCVTMFNYSEKKCAEVIILNINQIILDFLPNITKISHYYSFYLIQRHFKVCIYQLMVLNNIIKLISILIWLIFIIVQTAIKSENNTVHFGLTTETNKLLKWTKALRLWYLKSLAVFPLPHPNLDSLKQICYWYC